MLQTVKESLGWFKDARDRDLCILFISGHAVTSDGNYYFLPEDAVFKADESLDTQTAISYTEINSVLAIPGRKLLILDTCHAAGAGRSGMADTTALIREAKEYYSVVFSSSKANELSLEQREYEHGLFTYGIITGLEGEAASHVTGKITMKSLDSYVSDLVRELSSGRQNPITNTPDGYENFTLATLDK